MHCIQSVNVYLIKLCPESGRSRSQHSETLNNTAKPDTLRGRHWERHSKEVEQKTSNELYSFYCMLPRLGGADLLSGRQIKGTSSSRSHIDIACYVGKPGGFLKLSKNVVLGRGTAAGGSSGRYVHPGSDSPDNDRGEDKQEKQHEDATGSWSAISRLPTEIACLHYGNCEIGLHFEESSSTTVARPSSELVSSQEALSALSFPVSV